MLSRGLLRHQFRPSLFTSTSRQFSTTNPTHDQITEHITNNDVALFMKGTRKMPRCGFSNYVVQILKFYNVKQYKDVNCLEDENMREGIKTFSNWPTIP